MSAGLFRNWPAALGGAVLFLAVQMILFWTSAPVPGLTDSGWFLNSGRGVVAVCLALAAAGVLLGAVRRDGVTLAVSAALGASVAMTLTLLALGPGAIFPLVITIGGALIGAATVLGATAGMVVRRLLGLDQGLAEKSGG